MKMPSFIAPKKRLNAAAARRSRTLGLPEEMDYEEMGEPNMKLSRALLIVLLLHLVAVAGIVAFNTVKTRENLPPLPNEIAAETSPAASAAPALPNDRATAETGAVEKTALEKNVGEKIPAKNLPADSGKVYIVQKGDNPVKIARHFKVSEADLLALNQIGDSRKLQINQKLRIPERASSSAKRSAD